MGAPPAYPAETSDQVSGIVQHPSETVTLTAFAEMVYRHDIRILTRGGADLAHSIDLLGALRGALGQRLRRAASPASLAGQACTWRPASAFDVLWRKRRGTTGADAPAPYLMFSEKTADGALVIGMSLFGIASGWSGSVADALTAAMAEPVWLPGRQQVDLRPYDREIRIVQGTLLPEPQEKWRLEFETPLRLLRGGRPLLHGPSMMASLGNRITGMARWHGLGIAADWTALKEDWEQPVYDCSGMQKVAHVRHSARTGQHTAYIGHAGTMTITGLPAAAGSLLALGRVLHAGGGGAAGYGRYRLRDGCQTA